jgi:hypothetical protein
MADLAIVRTRIAEIEALLAAGETQIAHKGNSVALDLAALEAERDRLQRVIAAATHSPYRRVVFRRG